MLNTTCVLYLVYCALHFSCLSIFIFCYKRGIIGLQTDEVQIVGFDSDSSLSSL